MSDDEDLFVVFNDGGANATPTTLPLRERDSNVVENVAATAVTAPQCTPASPPQASPVAWPSAPPPFPPPPLSSTQASLSSTATTTTKVDLYSFDTASATDDGGLTIIGSTDADGAEGSAETDALSSGPRKTMREPNSRIRIRRGTKSLVQLPVFLSERPFMTFSQAQMALLRGGSDSGSTSDGLARTVVGAVIRKTDPKQGGKGPYAVVTLWNMTNPSPDASTELAFLLCGKEFDRLHSHMTIGTVIAVGHLARMGDQKSASNNNNSNSSSGSSSTLLLLNREEHVRYLGYAHDLGTCSSTSRKSGERCGALVNTSLSSSCTFHLQELRQVARGKTATGTAPALKVNGKPGARVTSVLTPQGNAIRPVGLAGSSTSTPVVAGPGAASRFRSSKEASQQHLRQSSFFTVRGTSGLPTQVAPHPNEGMGGAGIYSGVQRGTALHIAPEVAGRSLPQHSYPSPRQLGVSTKGREVLEAARQDALRKEEKRLLQAALGAKRPKPATATSTTATTSSAAGRPAAGAKRPRTASNQLLDMELIETIKARYQPLQTNKKASFTPLTHRFGSTESVVVADRSTYSLRQIAKESSSSLVSAVAASLASSAPSGAQRLSAPARAETGVSQLTAAAEALHSANDAMREEDARRQLDEKLDKAIIQETALEALSKITEQTVHALYCYGCDAWYLGKLPESCTAAHHRCERRETKKRFIQCDNCKFKTYVIGERTMPWKVFPKCPRCHYRNPWSKGNAAPELREEPEAPHPY